MGSETATAGSGTGQEKVSATVEGLQAGTSYYYRIVGEDENGANYGLIREFQTPPAVEALRTGAGQGVAPESATLTGSLKPGGVDAHYYFQCGTSEAYGGKSPEPPGSAAGTKKKKKSGQSA